MIPIEIFLSVDLPALLVAVLTAVSCSLLGSFLILRRQALISDALSHVVLPGLALSFMITGQIIPIAMLLGAFGAAIVAVLAIELIRWCGRLESGAAMGVVFTVMFAGGVVLLEQGVGGQVHLDSQHALYGSLETTVWITPVDWASLFDLTVWLSVPRQIPTLVFINVMIVCVIFLFYRELMITTFDPGLAHSLGIPVRWINFGFMMMVAMAAVGAFEAVGSILVIALFICPAAAARMITDRLVTQLWLSVLLGVSSAVLGYICAAWLPLWLGSQHSLTAAGMIAVVAGIIQLIAMLFAPRYGVWMR